MTGWQGDGHFANCLINSVSLYLTPLDLKRLPIILPLLFLAMASFGQGGLLSGNVMDQNRKALQGATAELVSMEDTLSRQSVITDNNGEFYFSNIDYGYYGLRVSFVGLRVLIIDSLHFRAERADFNLQDLVLQPAQSESLSEIVIYSEKPLIQAKDGNITFNAGESALSAGSTADELLTSVPLVAKDPDGKITVRGKEPRILIDDKPVELNLQQLQELLESMPGSSIEKIEVMTNPPPQYANEQGGVINIVTKKGRVGRTGRLSVTGGTRGEIRGSGNFTYRKQGFILSINAGISSNIYEGNGYSSRNNFYADSSNFFNTENRYRNKSLRPNLRVNLEYDFTKLQSLNVVLQLNQNDYLNNNITTYRNISRFGDTYRLSERSIRNDGSNINGNITLSYLLRTKLPGEVFRIIATGNLASSKGDRDYYQQFFNPDHTPNGIDSSQQQLTDNSSNGRNIRVSYDRPIFRKKTHLSLGSFYNRSNSDVNVDASYFSKSDDDWVNAELLSNEFEFHQSILNLRASLKQIISEDFSVTAGLSAENTSILFELIKESREAKNNYWTLLPFANMNRTWKDVLNLTLAYRRTIRRPGINELNPTIDFSDPYNIRFGNDQLRPSTADNFDLVIGRTKTKYYINLGLGYNSVQDIYSRVRTLLPDGRTQVTWENISGRKEYELSTWGGITINRKLRANVSATYRYNEYSEFDRTVNRYRNGGSFTSNFNSTYALKDVMNLTGSFTFNRFANPQGYARWNWSMNAGVQKKFFQKRLTVTVNFIDPFSRQRNRNYTYAPKFMLESYSTSNTRNFRVSVAYSFVKVAKRGEGKKPALKKGKAGS